MFLPIVLFCNEFEYEKRKNDDSNEIDKFFSCSDIDREDYIACDSNVLTSEMPLFERFRIG